MAKFDFRILLETIEGKKTSYISQSFVDTSQDLVLSASQAYNRITGSVSCSYQNSPFFTGDFNGASKFKDNLLLSASLSGSFNTGSIDFTATTSEYDRLLRYKFIGEKVCNVLGLPSSQWIYVDQVRLPVDDESNIFRGNIDGENIFVSDTLAFAGNSNINSDIPILINTGSDKHIKFIDERNFSSLGLIIGYDKSIDTYEISGSNEINFNIGGVDKLLFSDGTSQTTAGGGGSGTPGGSSTHVQFNDGGSLGGDAGFTYDKDTNSITAITNITASGNISASGASNIFNAMLVDEEISHTGDSNTKIRFTDDNIGLSAGGNTVAFKSSGTNFTGHITASGEISASGTDGHRFGGMIQFDNNKGIQVKKSAGTYETVVLGSTTDDIYYGSNGSNAFKSHYFRTYQNSNILHLTSSGGGNTGRVGVNKQNPTKTLEVAGDISASGYLSTNSHITASGNISSSGTIESTGNISTDGTLTAESTITSNAGHLSLTAGKIILGATPQIDVGASKAVTFSVNPNFPTIFYNSSAVSASNFTTHGNITASGNISASGTIYASKLEVTEITSSIVSSSTNILIENITSSGDSIFGDTSTDSHTFNGHITASGNISSSGGVVSSTVQVDSSIILGTDRSGHANEGGTNSKLFLDGGSDTYLTTDGENNTIKFFANNTEHMKLNNSYGLRVTGIISASGFISTKSNITASGNISSSGNLISQDITASGKITVPSAVNGGRIGFNGTDSTDNYILYTNFDNADEMELKSGHIDINAATKVTLTADTNVSGHITASGNISSSGTIYGEDAQFGSDSVKIDGSGGHITASGQISSSGKHFGKDFDFKLSSDDRTFKGNDANGVVLQDPSGGWAMRYGFLANGGTDLGGFGGFGGSGLTNFFIGGHYTKPVMTIQSGSTTAVGIGRYSNTTPPKALTVEGDISASGNLFLQGGITASTDIHIGGSIIHDGDPGTQLDFSGDQLIFNIGGETLLTLTENGSQDIVTIGDGGDVDFKVRTLGDDSTIFAQGSSDNVGIGTTSPGEKLEVIGNISSSGTITGLSGSFRNLDVLDNDAGANPRFRVGRNTGENIAFSVIDLDTTITADQDSDSNGNHNFILNRTFDGSGANNFKIQKGGTDQFVIGTGGDITASGNISSSGTITSNGGSMVDNLTFATGKGVRFVDAGQGIIGDATSITIDGDDTVNIQADKLVDIKGGLTDGVNIDGNITASGNISASGTIFASAFSSPDGDGDIDFSDSLDVSGHITASGNISASGNFIGYFPDTNDDAAHYPIVSTGQRGTLETLNALNINPSSGLVQMDKLEVTGNITANGNIVGDGSTTISNINHITASGNISSSGTLVANGITSSKAIYVENSAPYIYFTETDTSNAQSLVGMLGGKMMIQNNYNNAAGDLEIRTKNFDNAIFIDNSTDSIGIGDGSPSATLDVAGNIQAQSHITASGNISASGVVRGITLKTNTISQISDNGIQLTNGSTVLANPQSLINIVGDLFVNSHITASGQISSSGTILANNYDIRGMDVIGTNGGTIINLGADSSATKVVLGKENSTTVQVFLPGQVTASGNISSSGQLIADSIKGNILTDTITSTLPANQVPVIGISRGINVTGAITASGNISSSGTITAEDVVVMDDLIVTDDIVVYPGSLFKVGANQRLELGTTNLFTGNVSSSGYLSTNSHITASGNISGSATSTIIVGGDITTDENFLLSTNNTGIFQKNTTGAFRKVINFNASDVLEVGSAANTSINLDQDTEVSGHITASGNISGSSTSTLTIGGNASIGGTLTAESTITSNAGSLVLTAGNLIFGASPVIKIGGSNALTLTANLNNLTTFQNCRAVSVPGLETAGAITASGDISSSGAINSTQVLVKGETALSLLTTKGFVFSDAQVTKLQIGKGDTVTETTINGHITASGEISSSGHIMASEYKLKSPSGGDEITIFGTNGDGDFVVGDSGMDDELILYGNQAFINIGNGTAGKIGVNDNTPNSAFDITGDLGVSTHITASGNISASGAITASGFNLIGSGTAELEVNGHITASGNYSGSSTSTINVGGEVQSRGQRIGAFNGTNVRLGDSTQPTQLFGTSIDITGTTPFKVAGSITASGNISASGEFIGKVGTFSYGTGVESSAGDFSGEVIYDGNDSTNAGQIYYSNNGTWTHTNADAAATATGLIAVALGSNSTNNGMLLRGTVKLDHDPGGDIGVPLYLQSDNAGDTGDATSTAPSANNNIVRVIGYNLGTSGEIYFNPDNTFVEVSA